MFQSFDLRGSQHVLSTLKKLAGVVSSWYKSETFLYILRSEAPWEDEVRKPSVQHYNPKIVKHVRNHVFIKYNVTQKNSTSPVGTREYRIKE